MCITIDSDVAADGTRRTTRYDIDLFKCIYCGFCEEACPVDAIVLTRIHEYHMEHRGENIMSKDKLLAVGERYEAMIATDKAADAPTDERASTLYPGPVLPLRHHPGHLCRRRDQRAQPGVLRARRWSCAS